MPRTKNYPDYTLEEALIIPKAIFELGSETEVRRLTVFDHIGRAPESGPSRTLISTCNKYELINGSAVSDMLSVTDLGAKCVNPDISKGTRNLHQFKAGIENIEIFKSLHEKYVGSKMPARQVLLDELEELEVPDKDREAVADRYIENSNFVGVVKVLSGAERIIPIEQVIEESGGTSKNTSPVEEDKEIVASPNVITHQKIDKSTTDFDKICFYVTAIGSDDSEQRKHSDLFLGSIVEPAIEPLDLKVIRADQIAEPGMITSQVIEYIFHAKLVVADLSFLNPNVFYELALRHLSRKPTVQIVRKGDAIPFDVNQFRTVVIDCSSIYSLVPKLDSYRTDIRTHARSVLSDPMTVDNPVLNRFPHLELKLS